MVILSERVVKIIELYFEALKRAQKLKFSLSSIYISITSYIFSCPVITPLFSFLSRPRLTHITSKNNRFGEVKK